jgi:hypothetical protein
MPYVRDESLSIEEAKDGLVWCGELNILPTATNPLSGLDSYTKAASSIIPHAKVQLQSVPVMRADPHKFMYTTGAVTQRNYISQKAGQKAEFHHVFGALFVEIDTDGDFFARQLIADEEGGFYDLTTYYNSEGAYEDCSITAVHWGDIHAEMLDPDVEYGSWAGEGNLLDTLNPYYQFVHDLTDFKARNHHNIKDPHFLAEMHFKGTTSVRQGMRQAAEVLQKMRRKDGELVVVESNHDQAFRRWLKEADIRQDPANAEYYHKANAEIFRQLRKGTANFHVFEWAVREFLTPQAQNGITFLDEDDSFLVGGHNGIECGMHGHRGPNGARGNPHALRKLGRKCNVGHAHTAGIFDGIYVAGVSCRLDMGYNKGPSSWSQSHTIIYPNNKRAIITMRGKK